MAPDPNYPRWMFHPSEDPRIVHSEAEEAALGREWSRTVAASLPPQEKNTETKTAAHKRKA